MIKRLFPILLVGLQLLYGPRISAREYHFSQIEKIPNLSFLSYVFTGLDVLEQMDFAPLQGKTIAILCNQTSVDRNGRHVLDLIAKQPGIKVKTVFAPEFGLFGDADPNLKLSGKKSIEPLTGAYIVDLFGRYILPPDWSLSGVDLILIDIQDTGVRYSTFITTITKIIESASEWDIPLLVLDRPNPLRGDIVDGPIVRPAYQSFEGYHLVPIRHGLTIGEYVLMVNEMGWAKDLARVDLTIIPMANWRRRQWYDETKLPWVPPAPDIASDEILLAYTGMALLNGTNLNVGHGTDKPYLRVGAPWLVGQVLFEAISQYRLPGVAFKIIRYKPHLRANMKTVPLYYNEWCGGLELEITDRNKFNPLATATTIILLTRQLYPREFQWRGDGYVDKLFGHDLLRTFAAQGKPPDYLPPLWFHDVLRFNDFRQRFLLYE